MGSQDELTVRLRRLGDRARAARQAHLDACEARNDVIEEADNLGLPMVEIGHAAGMYPSQVQAIVAQRTARRQRQRTREG